MAFTARIKNHAATAAIIAAALVAALGIMAFVLALRSSRLQIPAGDVVSYRLRVQMRELISSPDSKKDIELPASVQEQDLHLIGVGGMNEVVLLTTIDGSDQVTLLSYAPNGSARRLDAAARVDDAGVAIGLFDFNLMPLPPGSEQVWNVDVIYALLPPAKRVLQGKARRMRSGSNPEFQLKLPASVEWIGTDQRYMQVRDLTSTYRFNTSKSLIERADISGKISFERDDGQHRFKVNIELELLKVGRISDDPTQVRNLALAGMDAQSAIAQGHRERLHSITDRLMNASVQDPRLKTYVQNLVNQIRHPAPTKKVATVNTSYAVHLATCPADRRTDAQRFVAQLASEAFRAYIVEKSGQLYILVGPYLDRDPAILRTLSQRYPQQRASWVEIKP
jgi:hypothetical protein